MIYFDFKIDNKEFSFSSPIEKMGAELTFTCFEAQLSMKYNGIDVFERKMADGEILKYTNISLLGFAVFSLNILSELGTHGRKLLITDGSADVFFEHTGSNAITVGVWKGTNPTKIPHDELREALVAFKERIRLLLIKRTPDIQKNPFWKEWFPETDTK